MGAGAWAKLIMIDIETWLGSNTLVSIYRPYPNPEYIVQNNLYINDE